MFLDKSESYNIINKIFVQRSENDTLTLKTRQEIIRTAAFVLNMNIWNHILLNIRWLPNSHLHIKSYFETIR